jgi:membrane associated rhomboid family serine protease
MIPISDEKKSEKFPLITATLIFFNVLIFLITLSDLDFFVQNYGFIPKKALGFTFISSIFLHANFSHLFGNMWFLWIFGDNVEAKIGRIKFLLLYFLSGFFSLIFYSMTSSQSTIPVVGASGAISGILGAYLVLFPRNKIKALIPFFYFYRIVFIPAIIYIGIWFLYQFLYMGVDPSVAYWGHIGGFLAGIFLIIFLKKK